MRASTFYACAAQTLSEQANGSLILAKTRSMRLSRFVCLPKFNFSFDFYWCRKSFAYSFSISRACGRACVSHKFISGISRLNSKSTIFSKQNRAKYLSAEFAFAHFSGLFWTSKIQGEFCVLCFRENSFLLIAKISHSLKMPSRLLRTRARFL
jgi:hypothetical protein